jgi:hypothetical protein
MSQHYTRNTVSTSKYCNVCKRMTQHAVFDRRVAHCLEHGGGKSENGYDRFLQLSDADQLREERLAIMTFCGGLTEQEALDVIEQKQGVLF